MNKYFDTFVSARYFEHSEIIFLPKRVCFWWKFEKIVHNIFFFQKKVVSLRADYVKGTRAPIRTRLRWSEKQHDKNSITTY